MPLPPSHRNKNGHFCPISRNKKGSLESDPFLFRQICPTLLKVVQILRGNLEVFVHFGGDSIVQHKLEGSGLTFFVELGNLKNGYLARSAGLFPIADSVEETVSTIVVNDKTQEFEVDLVARLILKGKNDALFNRGCKFGALPSLIISSSCNG